MGGSEVSVRVRAKTDTRMECTDTSPSRYEGEDDFNLDCSASKLRHRVYLRLDGARRSTVVPGRLNSTTKRNPRFDVPEDGEVDSDETYEYTLTASAPGADDGVINVTVTVLNKPAIDITCPGNPYSEYEGEEDFDLDCSVTGVPSGSTPRIRMDRERHEQVEQYDD